MAEQELFDLVIVGYGLTGLAAAMYAGRLEMKTLLIGELPGGLITWTDIVENYPGFKRLTGLELTAKLEEHAREYSAKFVMGRVNEIQKQKTDSFLIKTTEGDFETKSVLIATGTRVKELEVPGAKEFKQKGIQFCALCDGALFKGKDMAVVGGSDSAAKEAIVLAKYARTVYLIHRGNQIRAEPPNMERLKNLSNVETIFQTNVTEFKGDKLLTGVVLDKPYKGKKELSVGAAFMAIGHIPLSDVVKSLGVKTNDHGEIVINRNSETNVPGIFAAGDVVDTRFKQAIVGVGEAVSAVYSAFLYSSQKK